MSIFDVAYELRNDAYQLESMRDILRMNLWAGESLDNLYYIYSSAQSIGLAEVLLLVNYCEDNEMYSAIAARAIRRSLEREGVRSFCDSTPLREPLKGYLKLEGIEQAAHKDTILTLMPQGFKMAVSEDENVFE